MPINDDNDSLYDDSMYDKNMCASEISTSDKNKKTMTDINLPFEINYSTSKNNIYWSDDESTSVDQDDDTISTMSCCTLDTSVGNASPDTLEVYQLETDELGINIEDQRSSLKMKLLQLFALQIP